jgi:hypothetical protein
MKEEFYQQCWNMIQEEINNKENLKHYIQFEKPLFNSYKESET